MIHGLSDEQEEILYKLVVRPLKQAGCQVWVFGSRARGDQKEFSDIDLLYKPPQNKEIPPAFVSGVRESIEESNLPYKVDLVSIDDLAQSYREDVLKERKELWST